MRALRFRSLLAASVGIALVAGCGIDIDIEADPKIVSGALTNYDITMTNASACPLISLTSDPVDFIFLPFVPASVVEESEILALACGLTPFPPPAQSTSLAGIGEIPWDQARAELAHAAAAAAATDCSGMGVTCMPASEGSLDGTICDTGGPIPPGGMRNLTCQATAPFSNGPFYAIAFSALIASGVCEAGTGEAGQACNDGSDCGMGGACSPGICDGGMNDGNGCTDAGDCSGGTCILCGDNAGIGFACAQQVGTASPAPSLTPWGIGAALLGLGAVAFRRFRRV
jgi:MYXO-CTERM domain-containing protein